MANNLQEIIITNLLYNEDYAHKVYPFTKVEYFEPPYTEIVKVATKFYATYGEIPKKDELKIELQNLRGITDRQLKEATEALNALHIDPIDPTWLMTNTEKFYKEQSVMNAIVESANILQDQHGNRGEILNLVQNALAVSFDTNVGHDYFEDYEKRFEDYHRTEDKVSWGIKSLDDVTNGGMSKKNLICAVASTGCHAKGTKVVMADGSLKNVEDVELGDRLMGYKGQVRTVLRLCRGRDKMYRITPNRMESFVVNSQHVLPLVRSTNGHPRCELTVEQYLKYAPSTRQQFKLLCNDAELTFSEAVDLPIDPYFLGLWLGDGNSATMAISNMDAEILSYLTDEFEFEGVTSKLFDLPNNRAKLVKFIRSDLTKYRNPLVEAFESVGIKIKRPDDGGITCYTKFIPEVYFHASVEQRYQLLAGLIDTDGTKTSYGSNYAYYTVSDQLANDVLRLGRSLGFVCTKRHQRINEKFWTWSITISGDNVNDVPLRVKHKQCNFDFHRNRNPHYRGFTCEYVGEDDFYGFTLDGDHLYYTDNFVLNHNSGKSAFMCNITANALRQGKNALYISLEMSEDRIAERIDANLMHTSISNLHDMSEDTFSRNVQTLKGKCRGRLIIKEYPTSSASVINFKALLEELKLKKNFVPDLIVIDYLNLAQSARVKIGQTNSYGYIKAISEELRGLAVEYNAVVLTATQTNRNGFNNSDIDLTDISESIGVTFVMDFQFAIIRTEQMDEQNQVMIKQLKNRYGDLTKRREIYLGFNRDEMRFYDADAEAATIRNTFSAPPSYIPVPKKAEEVKGKTTNDFGGFKF